MQIINSNSELPKLNSFLPMQCCLLGWFHFSLVYFEEVNMNGLFLWRTFENQEK